LNYTILPEWPERYILKETETTPETGGFTTTRSTLCTSVRTALSPIPTATKRQIDPENSETNPAIFYK
jgi:hypothetical protein